MEGFLMESLENLINEIVYLSKEHYINETTNLEEYKSDLKLIVESFLDSENEE